MVPSIMQQILHDPKLVKLDLSSLVYASAGAAYLPPELRLAFGHRAKKVPFFLEGSDFPCHRSLMLMTTSQDTGCLNAYDPFTDCLSIHDAKEVRLRAFRLFCSLFRACLGAVSTQYEA